MTLNIGGQKFEMVDKPAVEFAGLKELGEQFVNAFLDEPCKELLVATIQIHTDENLPDLGAFFEFNWAKNFGQGMSLEQLKACQWTNNLDSLIDYTEVVNMPLEVAFGALECARQGRSVYIENVDGLDYVWFGQVIKKS